MVRLRHSESDEKKGMETGKGWLQVGFGYLFFEAFGRLLSGGRGSPLLETIEPDVRWRNPPQADGFRSSTCQRFVLA